MLAAAAAAICSVRRPHSCWQLQLQPFVVRIVLVHVAAAAVAIVSSGPPSRVSSGRGDGGLVGGKSNEIYPLRLAFRAREGLGTCVVAMLVVSLLRWVVSLPRWTLWVFSVTRRVLPLLATLKMVFDMTRRGETLLISDGQGFQ